MTLTTVCWSQNISNIKPVSTARRKMLANSPTRLHCICVFMVVLAMLNVGAGPFQPLNYDGGMEDRRP